MRDVQLAAKKRIKGKSVAQVLVNLGREDDLDRAALTRLVASINRYLGVADAPAPDVTAMVGEDLAVTGSRPTGATYLLDGLWRQLGIDTALRAVLGLRRFTTDVERVLFALVANRAVDPLSKLAAAEWATRRCCRCSPGYPSVAPTTTKRPGTSTLFAALEIATGKVTGACKPRHRHQRRIRARLPTFHAAAADQADRRRKRPRTERQG